MNRLAVTAALAVAGSLALAAPAGAATLTADYVTGTLTYAAGAGESNQLSLQSGIQLEDNGVARFAVVALGAYSCSIDSANQATCGRHGIINRGVLNLGDGTDSLDAGGISLPLEVVAGPGAKTIHTGSGNDTINVVNGSVDRVSCGAGDDTVVADTNDVVDTSCEHVTGATVVGVLPTGSSPGRSGDHPTGGAGDHSGGAAGGNGSSGTVFTTPLGLTMPDRTISVPRPNTAMVPLSCDASATSACTGDVILELPAAAAKPRMRAAGARVVAARGHYIVQQRKRLRRLGRTHFKLAPGQSAKLPVRIAFRGHYALASKRHRARALLKVVERDAAGKVLDTQTRMVTLKLVNKWSRIPRRHR